jgi:hypothetical protein
MCIIFFTNKRLIDTDYGAKVSWLFIIENFVMAVLLLWKSKNMPTWFEFKDKIEINYLKKYAYISKAEEEEEKKFIKKRSSIVV